MKNKLKVPRFWLLIGILVVLSAGVWLLVWLLTPKGDDLLLQVLNSNASFIDETDQPVRLTDYTPLTDGTPATPLRHAFVDMDGDGRQEMVVYYPQGSGTYLVFHIYENRVYGYAFPEMDFQNLKTDGTFLQMRNTYGAYFYGLTFQKESYELTEQAYLNWNVGVARLDGKDAEQNTVTAFAVDFWKKAPVQWTFAPDTPDPMDLYNAFLQGEATALDGYTPRKLEDFLLLDKAHKYAFFDMTGDGQKELCLQTGMGLYTFTVRESSLRLWYAEAVSGARLLENGMLVFADISYTSPLTLWDFWAMSEQGRAVFKLHFSQSGSGRYIWEDELITKEEFDKKTKYYLDLQEIPWSIAVESPTLPNKEISPLEAYEAFLAGEVKAIHSDGRELPLSTYLTADSGTFSYGLLDMTGDGVGELLIKMTYNLHIFTVKDGRVCLWHTADAQRYTLLNNGALLYERHGTAPNHTNYEYRELDENGAVKFKIVFAWYDGTTIEPGVVHPDRYEINNQEVTKEEYETQVAPYLLIGSDQIRWYPTAEQNLTRIQNVLSSKAPFITSEGESYLLSDYKLGGVDPVVPKKYAFVDLNGDGTEELVAYTDSNGGTYLVFHTYYELVYGFVFQEREMVDLKCDGTFMRSESAGINTFCRLSFAPNGFAGCHGTLSVVAFWDDIHQAYRLNGDPATADQVSVFVEEFAKKQAVTWLDKI